MKGVSFACVFWVSGPKRLRVDVWQAATSMCEGNLLGTHLLGDAMAFAAALAQAPWLCGAACTFPSQAGCFAWLLAQVSRLVSFISPVVWSCSALHPKFIFCAASHSCGHAWQRLVHVLTSRDPICTGLHAMCALCIRLS